MLTHPELIVYHRRSLPLAASSYRLLTVYPRAQTPQTNRRRSPRPPRHLKTWNVDISFLEDRPFPLVIGTPTLLDTSLISTLRKGENQRIDDAAGEAGVRR